MLTNLRNALMSGKRLPYDAEVEYLESTGTQWFDTGFKASGGCIVEYKFKQGILTDRGYLFGSHNPPNNSANDWNRNQSGILSNIYSVFNKCEKMKNIYMGNINTSNFHVIKFDTRQTLLRGWFDASLVVDDITTGVLDPVSNIVGFYSPYYQNIAKGSLAWAKIWDVNGFLVRDLIPVRVGTVGYMYDRVSGKLFGNAGTGDFVLGPDVVPVEYLQGVLGGYVDTGIKSLNTISADISFGVVNPTHDSTRGIGVLLCGNGTTWAFNSYTIFFQNTLNQPDYKSLSSHGRNNILVQTPQNSFDCNVGVSCDGTSTATVTTTYNRTTTSRSISISAIDGTKNFTLLWNRLLDDNTVITRLKSAEFISGGATIAKFVPVRVGTEGAMMDVLTRRIYRNAGTGAFTYGNDLKYPIPAS